MKLLSVMFVFVVASLHVFAVKSEDIPNPPVWMRRLTYVTKPLIIPGLIWFYLTFAENRSHLLLAGLCAGWLGDLALMIKPDRKVGDIMFGVGLLCFLAGHVFYSILFFSRSYPLFETKSLSILLYLPYVLCFLILYRYIFIPGTPKILKRASIVYSAGLTIMSFAALTTLIHHPSFATAILFIGTLSFFASDAVLALRFLGKKSRLSEQYILAGYILGQLFIVMGNVW